MKVSYLTQGPFLRWWILMVLLIVGSIIAIDHGLLTKLINADLTRISFIIFALFMVYSIHVGCATYRACKGSLDQNSVLNSVWFISDQVFTLGMIGTIIGFIYMLSTNLYTVDISNQATLRSVMLQMGAGMGTALYTTASGLVCGLLLKVQAFNLEYFLDASDAKG